MPFFNFKRGEETFLQEFSSLLMPVLNMGKIENLPLQIDWNRSINGIKSTTYLPQFIATTLSKYSSTEVINLVEKMQNTD